VVLGTASQVPTRDRNHNGHVLLWDQEVILFDPGEGTQRQLTRFGVAAARITRICLTHAHGDHCLGLPGVVQRLALDGVDHEVPIHYPDSAAPVLDHLLALAASHHPAPVRRAPLSRDGDLVDLGDRRLLARPLQHTADVLGYRLEDKPARTLLPDRLAAHGLSGPAVGQLLARGEITTAAGARVTLDQVSRPRPGQAFALVLDTAVTPAITPLLAGADVALVEATFLAPEAELAARFQHLTADQAGRLAADAGVGTLVLTHFSGRYRDRAAFAAEAGAHHPHVVAAADGEVVPLPPRRRDLTP
jgi:ribonuclease Z